MELGLIGFPAKHSLSPWIHQQFLKKAGIEGNYTIMEISPDDSFEKELDKIKRNKMDGFNVTVPYKKKIMPFLDEIDDNAQLIGAVNTVVCKEGKWIGYNTDGVGYAIALKNKHPSFYQAKTNKILIIGAGGAAHGIYYGLVSEGFNNIDIANRTSASAQAIAELGTSDTKTFVLTLEEAQEGIKDYDLVIQTTSVGMKPDIEESIISTALINKNSVASDIIYQPINTKFLTDAKEVGATVHYGHTMLLYQAQYSFELWTNKQVPIGDMDQQLKNILEGR